MGWKIRPDCVVEGCDAEQGVGRQWCRDHDPERCAASLSDNTIPIDEGDRRCRNRALRGSLYCKRHGAAAALVSSG